MSIFISGGCKNGKSTFAQEKAVQMSKECDKKLYYIATMIPKDEEDNARIARHVAERKGLGFHTIEKGYDLSEILQREDINSDDVFLIDSVTALVENQMFGNVPNSETCHNDLLQFIRKAPNTILVSDNIFADAERYDETTEEFRKVLASVDRILAQTADQVYEVTYSNIISYK